MSTYNMTPAERRARAQALVQYRENRSLYHKYLREKEEVERQLEQERLKSVWAENEKNSQNVLVRGLSTIGDVVGNALTGAVKGLEGIADLGIAAVGAVGGIFSDDFQDTMRKAVSYDFAGEIVGKPLQEAMKYSYLENGGIVEQVSSSVGQMLPAVAITIATAGAGAPAAASQSASLVTMGMSAAGTSTEEAFNEGANYYAGLGYGMASGLVEVGTEKLFGATTKALTGAGWFDGITRSVAQTGWKRVALDVAEEGFEEMVAEAARPALKTIYKGTDALSDYGSLDYWKGVGEAGLVGGLTALAYSGSVGYGLSKAGIGYSGKEADIADSLTEIGSLREKTNNLQAEDNLDETNKHKIAETIKKNYQNIEGVLKSVSETRRAKLIEKFSLSKAFNADGSMSDQLSAWFNGDSTLIASLKNFSVSLLGNEATIQSDLDKISEDAAKSLMEQRLKEGKEITIEQAREEVGKFSVLTSEMSEKAQASRRKFNKALNALNRLTGLQTSFVITESNKTFSGSLVDNERMYINADAFENDTWAETLVHEYTHLEEGSEEYAKMVDFLQSDDILVDVEIDGEVKRIPLWQKAQAAVLGKDYGFDENKIQIISEKVDAQMSLTPEEAKLYRKFRAEVAAHETQYLLGTEAFIDKIVASDRTLARKLVDKILNLKEAFSKVGDKATRGQLKMLRQAEKLYLDAARKAGDMRLVKYILSRSPETEEDVDTDERIVYNKKWFRFLHKNFPPENEVHSEAHRLAIWWANRKDVQIGDQTLISMNDRWYLVEKFEKAENHYQVEEYVTKTEFKKIFKEIKEHGRSCRVKSISGNAYCINNFNKSGYTLEGRTSSSVGYETRYGGEDHQIQRVDNEQVEGRERPASNGDGDSSGGGANQQKLGYAQNANNDVLNDTIVSDSNGVVRFNLSTFHEGGRAILEKNLLTKGFHQDDVSAALQTMDDLASFFEKISTKYKDVADWNNAKIYYDDQGRAIYSAMVKNGDYPINIDLSTICRKRKALTRVLNELVKRDLIGGFSLTADNIVKINDILKKNGFEVACPACFVETKRYRTEAWANDFIDCWNGIIDTLNIQGVETLDFSHGKTTVSNGDVDTSGLEAAVKKGAFGGRENNLIAKTILEHPELRGRLQKGDFFGTVGLDTIKKVAPDLYTRILNKTGFATPKITQEVIPYNSELGLFDKLAEKAKGVGGVRMFSFSDFTIEQVFDYMQVIADVASQGATMHTYTKVISFAKIFGKTGIKINMSMIPDVDKTVPKKNAGLDSDGNLIWSEYGVDYNEAITLMSEEGYSENVGTATIGISDAHIRKLLANKYTNYIIPYYTSNINPIVAKMTSIDWYTDYTSQQNTRYRNGVGENIRYSEGQTEKHPGNPTKVSKGEEFNFFESLDRLGDAKAMAREYLAYCDEHGFVPKFEQFTSDPNYYKLLIDFQVYDTLTGEPSPQRPVTLTFPDNVKALIEEELDVQENVKKRENEVFEETLDEIVETLSTTNSDIRFSLVEDPIAKPYFYKLSDGQVKKLLANWTKMKVYSKVESEGIINDILGNFMSFGDVYGVLSGKSKAEVIDMLWRGLNTAEPGRQMKVALDVAEYIIQHAAVESMYEDAGLEAYVDTIALLKPYLHKINLDGIKDEIKHRYDRDNSPYLLWGKRKGESGLSADVIAMELDGLGFHIDAINEADIFFQIDEAYRRAVAGLKKEAKCLLDSVLNAKDRKQLKQEIARQVLISFDEKGKPSKLSRILDEYAKKAKVWREKYYEERYKNKLINRVLDKIQKLKDIKLGTFLNASQFKNDAFKGSIERLSNIKYRGNLNKSGTRKILGGLAEWYVKENPMLQSVFDEGIASALLTLTIGEGELTVDELKALEDVIDYFKHFLEIYNKVWRGGKYVEKKPIAEKDVSIFRRNKPAKVGWLRKFFENYLTTFGDPMTVARYMDGYSDGFYTEILQELRNGAVGASIMEMEMREPLEAFYKKHKKFLKEISTKTIEYQGTQMPLDQAMYLYMLLNRYQAILGLAESGFAFDDGVSPEPIRPIGFAVEEGLEYAEIRVRAKEVQSALASQFTDVEKEYISIAENIFNGPCKEAKEKTDLLRRGYTNALEDYYVPVHRANIAYNVDKSTFFDEVSRASNPYFNRDTVKGAKNELFINPLSEVLDRHIRAVAQYANLALVIDQYNILYNLDIGDNPNKPTSVKTESVGRWSKGEKYFQELISDIQGISRVKGGGNRFWGWLRGGYAKAKLGANPKVWVSQLSSFAAASVILDIDCIIKGIGVKASDVDEYCRLAKVRNTENAAALAQGVVEKTGKIGDITMKPTGIVDRFVIARLFGACQLQIKKNEGLKIGTKENKVKAGELLETVILETQQNALATEKSSAMRSGSEFTKTWTMFSADAMKVTGRVIDAIGEVCVWKAKRNIATDPDEIASLDKKIKAANKKARRAVGALVSSAVFMALVAQLFRWLYNKDDEDDNVALNITVDTIGNLLGGLPVIRDFHTRLVEGYDVDNFAYSAINDMFDSVEKIFSTVGNIFEDDKDPREVASAIKNLLYAVGQMFGIPIRNLYNVIYGLTKRISPSTAYSIDDMFYKQNYRSDLAKAIENEDEAMIATITSLMLDENIGGITDSDARKELDSLVQKGFNVIPKSVSKKITYDGVEYELTPNQIEQFENVYFVANEALSSLVKMSQYKGATDEVKAKAVNFIYNVYYNLALQDFLGVDLETKSILFAEAIDIEKLAIIVATANSLKADLEKGNAISGTRKAKIQSYVNSLQLKAVEKYMIMGYLGYKNTKGEVQVKAYINRLSLTKTEKAKLLKYSGYAS